MSQYLENEADGSSIEALSKMFEDVEVESKEKSAAMQERTFDLSSFGHRFYHEAPNDLFELLLLQFSYVDKDGDGYGGLNALRLVSKRCMQVVESVATTLADESDTDLLPVSALRRCKRIQHIRCYIPRSLEGCPMGLKSLAIGDGDLLQSLEPLSACKELESFQVIHANSISDISSLSSCKELKKVVLQFSNISDLNPFMSMSLLEELNLCGEANTSIKDISSLSQCKKLKKLKIEGNYSISDLSPLWQCPDLEELSISWLPLIKDLSLFEKGFTNLRDLDIDYLPLDDLSPLIKLQNLKELGCVGIPKTTTLLPLARCHKLRRVRCSENAKDKAELKKMRPSLHI